MKRPAILGGKPAFGTPLHVGRPNLPGRKLFDSYVDRIFDSRWLTNNGPLVREFQEKLEEFLRVSHVIPVSNGTIALELAERALNFEKEAILPSFTFIATPHSLKWQQIEPVFADTLPEGVTIDPDSVRNALTGNTTGLIGVHVYGYPCKHGELAAIASRNGLGLLYDAAHAFGCEVKGQPVAGLGDASVFSFHATKFFNSFEGGAIATNNDELAEKIRLMTNFGFGGREKDKVDYLGINGKMTEISAAMGLAMFDSIEEVRSVNEGNYLKYREVFSQIEGLDLILPPPELTRHNWQYVIAAVNGKAFGLDRDALVKALEAENVLVRRYFYPGCHRMIPYSQDAAKRRESLPNTEKLADSVISFPTGQTMGPREIEGVAECLKAISEHSKEIIEKTGSR